MARFIVVNSNEINIGVSAITLTLAEKLNYMSNKKVIIVELDYENPSFCCTLERESSVAENLEGILPYLNKSVVDNELLNIIKVNTKRFKNSQIGIIYGRTKKEKIPQMKLDILLKALGELYDIVIIDYGDKKLPNIMKEIADVNLLVIQATYRFINNLQKNKDDYIYNKTQLLINNCSKGLSKSEISFILDENIKDIKVMGQLPASNTLTTCVNKGIINIEKGNYSDKLEKLAAKICNELEIDININKSLLKKLFIKDSSEKEAVYIEQFKSVPLGKILIEQKVCTEEDIEKCLQIQAELLENGGK